MKWMDSVNTVAASAKTAFWWCILHIVFKISWTLLRQIVHCPSKPAGRSNHIIAFIFSYFDILFDKILIVSLVSVYLVSSCEEKGGPGSGVPPPLEYQFKVFLFIITSMFFFVESPGNCNPATFWAPVERKKILFLSEHCSGSQYCDTQKLLPLPFVFEIGNQIWHQVRRMYPTVAEWGCLRLVVCGGAPVRRKLRLEGTSPCFVPLSP